MQIKLKDLDTRLVRIERVMANQSLLEVANQLEALRSDVRAMHAPCSLTCETQPIETSWTRFLSSLRRSAIVFRVCASSSWGW